ncbi:MAG: hypothetical protein ACHREM_01925 [Polyangiales bacterium]
MRSAMGSSESLGHGGERAPVGAAIVDRRATLRAIAALASSLAACGAHPARSKYDALRVPDERTAIAWIARAFRKSGFEVESGRVVQIDEGVELTCDVAAVDAPWGVAWLRSDEQVALIAKHLPMPPEVEQGALWVHHGTGDDTDQRVLALIDKHFQYDPDPRGEGVVRSMQEVEARAIRDVSDFLERAKAGSLP